MLNARIGAEELGYISMYQTLRGDKNWNSYYAITKLDLKAGAPLGVKLLILNRYKGSGGNKRSSRRTFQVGTYRPLWASIASSGVSLLVRPDPAQTWRGRGVVRESGFEVIYLNC